jgi:HD superfamily phosphohydrolase
MDTSIFQRLRGHKQLGLSDRVYSSAEHSRFQHAIGTLFLAIFMLDIINRNAELYPKPRPFTVDDYGALITRLAALIHDIVNIPFGHTIEDEGLLIPKDWKDEKRVKAVFDDEGKGSLFEAVVDAIIRAEPGRSHATCT